MTRVRRRPVHRLIRTTGPRTRRPIPHRPPRPRRPRRHRTACGRRLLWAGAVAGLGLGGYFLAPTVKTMLDTVSTDDAYVNGHVTYVAPRVAGQVSRVLVDDNDRVSKGDLLVQLDKEPYQIQVDLKKAAVVNAEADLEAARAQVRGILAQAREPALEAPEGDRGRRRQGGAAQGPGRGPAGQGGDPRPRQGRPRPGPGNFSTGTRSPARSSTSASTAERTAEAAVKQALEEVHETRVALGLDPHPEGKELDGRPRRHQPDLLRGQRGVEFAAPNHDAGRLPARLRHPHASAGPRRVRPGATRTGTSTASWSGWCRRPPPSGRPRPSSSRPGATSPRPS